MPSDKNHITSALVPTQPANTCSGSMEEKGPEKYKNWPDKVDLSNLLGWATTHTDPQVAGKQGTAEPIDPKWLEVVLGRSDAVRMRDCVDSLKRTTEANSQDALQAWEELHDLLEDLDNARDFGKMGLWSDIVRVLKDSNEPEHQMWACWCVGTAVQNHPEAIRTYLRADGFDPLVHLLERGNLEVQSKALLAISSLIRNDAHCFSSFYGKKSFERLLFPHLTHSDLPSNKGRQALARKILFLLRNLVAVLPDLALELVTATPSLSTVLRVTDDADLVVKAIEILAEFVNICGVDKVEKVTTFVSQDMRNMVDAAVWASFVRVYEPRGP